MNQRILGIDPGSRVMGYGLIDAQKGQLSVCDFGCIRTVVKQPISQRLATLFTTLDTLITRYQPDALAIENVFMHKNPAAALKLGQARGVALAAGGIHQLALGEYSPREIKQAVVGYGNAEKSQVQLMIRAMLKLTTLPPTDAADALAVAVCHYQRSAIQQKWCLA